MRFVQGIDYGRRKGTLGFAIHMAEGGDGTVRYLARHAGETEIEWKRRVRGVSANFVVLSTGEVVQMVAWANASGSMNPADRGDTSGFYRTQVIQAVLGSKYVDPNAWSLSVEVTGFRAKGPNAKQTAAIIALVDAARQKYPTMRGAYGHADQTDTKGCPGTAPGMMAVWDTIGHGIFKPPEDDMDIYSVPGNVTAHAAAGTPYYSSPTSATPAGKTAAAQRFLLAGQDRATNPTAYMVDGAGDGPSGPMRWMKSAALTDRQPAGADCSAIQKQLDIANGRINGAITILGGN